MRRLTAFPGGSRAAPDMGDAPDVRHVREGQPASNAVVPTEDVLELPLQLRERSRFCAALKSGEEVAVVVDRGTLLRGGDWLVDEDGALVRVAAAEEPLLKVIAAQPGELVRAAYHLGNRHVRLQIAEAFLQIEPDPVLAEMLRHLGFEVTEVMAPFEPEGGIYGYAQSTGHHHGHSHSHSHSHSHPHPHPHEHEHTRGHRHDHPHDNGHSHAHSHAHRHDGAD